MTCNEKRLKMGGWGTTNRTNRGNNSFIYFALRCPSFASRSFGHAWTCTRFSNTSLKKKNYGRCSFEKSLKIRSTDKSIKTKLLFHCSFSSIQSERERNLCSGYLIWCWPFGFAFFLYQISLRHLFSFWFVATAILRYRTMNNNSNKTLEI